MIVKRCIPWNKGLKWSKEVKRKISDANKGKKRSEEYKRECCKRMKGEKNPFYGKKHTEETKIKISEKLKKRFKNPKNHSMYGRHHSEETKKKLSENKERSNKISNALKGRNFSEEHKKKLSKVRKKLFKQEKLKVWNKGITGWETSWKGKHHSKKTKKKISEIRKKDWQNPKYVKKLIKSMQVKPNKSEKQLNYLIKKVTKDFKYNGDFSQGITIGGRIPDFINCNGKKQVIEMFGEVFHDPEKAFVKVNKRRTHQGTINHYKKYGFKCLIIWDYELKNPGRVIERIEEFSVYE